MAAFPFDVWGKVTHDEQARGIEQIKIVRSKGGGFLILTRENGSEFDTWVETLEDVEADLQTLQVEWPA